MGRKKVGEGGTMPATVWQKGQVTNPNGRVSTYTEELGERIINLLWSGECRSLHAVGALPHMPTRQTIYNWKKIHPAFAEALEEAQASVGEIYADDNDKIVANVLAGRVEPAAASVAIKSNQWKAIVTNPKTFANKSYVQKDETLKVTTTHINRIDINGLDEEQLDAIEAALNAKLLTGPNGGTPPTRDV